MRSRNNDPCYFAHAEGEVGDVIGWWRDAPARKQPCGNNVHFHRKKIKLTYFMLNEPRGGVFRHGEFIGATKHPDADAAFISWSQKHRLLCLVSNSIVCHGSFRQWDLGREEPTRTSF